jgi:hypothetical protein
MASDAHTGDDIFSAIINWEVNDLGSEPTQMITYTVISSQTVVLC